MNTLELPTGLPTQICVKIDLSSLFSLQPKTARAFEATLEKAIAAPLRDGGNLCKAQPSKENNFATDQDSTIIICHGSQTICLFDVVDRAAALATVRAGLESVKMLRYSQFGWRDPNEDVLNIVYPQELEEPFAPILATLFQWLEELMKTYPPNSPGQ